ncbi:polyphosphate polymerase domain-containing protein [Paenibacillus thermoaerophilus]|uniref:Polyphosphate polymerase domain-containing protein n=1 Tax=Paenibacillus thermoaerophilus TaxID=1215385 RepID=A0ABW2V256_9BACL|nr:polyphosphate polymerase domain-containing protein [Paenibacillus thermoaerophilus]TMV11157.1 polyphosphate polymerase domain-containing protein [Paenibacillus thermoaerophilus]
MHKSKRTFRTEHKYYLHVHDYLSIRSRISAVLPMDSHSIQPDGYCIRSLYFDGPHDHALYDKNNGIFSREKYRIRIYNGSDDVINLERKSKRGDFVCKESVRISREEYERIRAGDCEALKQRDSELLRDFHAALAYRAFRPTAIVDYWREAYVYEYGNVRITFDKKLSSGINTTDLFDEHLSLQEAIPATRTIMEVKFDSFLPDMIRQLIQPVSHLRSSISKYVICREIRLLHFKEKG